MVESISQMSSFNSSARFLYIFSLILKFFDYSLTRMGRPMTTILPYNAHRLSILVSTWKHISFFIHFVK